MQNSSWGLVKLLFQHGLIPEIIYDKLKSFAVTDHHSNEINKYIASLDKNLVLNLLAQIFNLPILELKACNLNLLPKKIFSLELITEFQILPLTLHGKNLKLAIADPTTKELFTELSFKSGYNLALVLVDHEQLIQTIDEFKTNYYNEIEFNQDTLYQPPLKTEFNDNTVIINAKDEDQPIVKFVHKLIFDAVQMNASDIHFDPYEKSYDVRYRIDGKLVHIINPIYELKEKIISRIKVVAKLDIGEKRLPQDGRLRLNLPHNKIVDFRVSTIPTIFGEKVVLRILNQNLAVQQIANLGLLDEQLKQILQTIKNPYGMILVTGPTGSGKSITLYNCLQQLNDNSKNILAVEDPIEIPIVGINQVTINEKIGLDFAAVLRSFLRQDPDIIMVGEIRDAATLNIAVKAAQTGHLVLSTLHTNNAAAAFNRMLNMGVPSYNLGDSVLLVIAQRLIRKLCINCKRSIKKEKNKLLYLGFTENLINNPWVLYQAVGCQSCNNSGYSGRTGIFELLLINEEIKELIIQAASTQIIMQTALKYGMISLRIAALFKVMTGITTLEEAESQSSALS